MKTFKFAGSTRGTDGKLKLRTYNDPKRTPKHAKGGHTEINLHELPQPMTKEDAAQYLFKQGLLAANLVPGAKQAATVKITVPNAAIIQLTGAKITVEPELTAQEAAKIRNAWNKKHKHLSYTE
jgi:hypothetical protein